MRPLEPCVQLPLTVSRVEWVARARRTRIPPAPLHNEWRLEVDLRCETSAFRAVEILETPDELRYSRRSDASDVMTFEVNLSPADWDGSDWVHLHAGVGCSAAVESAQLKHDPQAVVSVGARRDVPLRTGTVADIADLPAVGLRVRAVIVAVQDTRVRRGRWHVKHDLLDPGPYAFLTDGSRSGSIALDED